MKCIYFKMETSDFEAYNQAITFRGLISLLMKTETDESISMAFLQRKASSKSEHEGLKASQSCGCEVICVGAILSWRLKR